MPKVRGAKIYFLPRRINSVEMINKMENMKYNISFNFLVYLHNSYNLTIFVLDIYGLNIYSRLPRHVCALPLFMIYIDCVVLNSIKNMQILYIQHN